MKHTGGVDDKGGGGGGGGGEERCGGSGVGRGVGGGREQKHAKGAYVRFGAIIAEFSDSGKGRKIASPSGFSDALTSPPHIGGSVGAPRTLRDGVPRAKHVVGTGALERRRTDAIPTTEKSAGIPGPGVRRSRGRRAERLPGPSPDEIICFETYLPKYNTHLKLNTGTRSMHLTSVSD